MRLPSRGVTPCDALEGWGGGRGAGQGGRTGVPGMEAQAPRPSGRAREVVFVGVHGNSQTRTKPCDVTVPVLRKGGLDFPNGDPLQVTKMRQSGRVAEACLPVGPRHNPPSQQGPQRARRLRCQQRYVSGGVPGGCDRTMIVVGVREGGDALRRPGAGAGLLGEVAPGGGDFGGVVRGKGCWPGRSDRGSGEWASLN
eukprot:gene22908-biopygen2791